MVVPRDLLTPPGARMTKMTSSGSGSVLLILVLGTELRSPQLLASRLPSLSRRFTVILVVSVVFYLSLRQGLM